VIDLGDQQADSPLAKTIAAAFVLPPNEISQPIQTELGWHLFEVTSLTPETVQAYDTVKDKVRDAVAQEKAVDAMYDASVQLEDQVAAGAPFPEVAKNVNAKLLTIDAIDHDGKDAKGADVADLPDRASFIKTAFATASGSDSGLKELANRQGYYVLKVDAVTPPKPKPFADVRGDVVAMWDKQARQNEAQALADKLLDQVKANAAMTALASQEKRASYAPLGPVTRFGEALQRGVLIPSELVSPEVLAHLFDAKVGEAFAAPVADGVVVARLKDIQTAQPTGDLAQGDAQLKSALQSSIASDLMEQLTHGFSSRYPVEVNNKVVDDMVAQAR
jgi:peptidyl-prolyl cis-trans isomerase D